MKAFLCKLHKLTETRSQTDKKMLIPIVTQDNTDKYVSDATFPERVKTFSAQIQVDSGS